MNNKLFNRIVFEIINLFIEYNNITLHGRRIARELKGNQRTIQLNLNNLASNKILLVEKAGRNKQYQINLENPKTRSMLLMTECYKTCKLLENFEIEQIINDLKKITSKPFLVFGSYAKGYAVKDSDLDILFIDSKKIDVKNIQFKYKTTIHLLSISEKKFIKSIRNKEAFPTEVTTHHVICQGYEFFINQWVKLYGKH